MGNAIVNVFGFAPIKSKFTPSFQCNKYKLGSFKQEEKVGKAFMEENVLYDMLKRNSFFFGTKIVTENSVNENIQVIVEKIKSDFSHLPIELSTEKKENLFKLLEEKQYEKLLDSISELQDKDNNDFNYSKNIDLIINELREIKKLENNKEEKSKT